MSSSTPETAQTVSAYFTVRNAAAALDFYARAFGAEEIYRLTDTGGRIGHAEMRIGNSVLMLSDEHPDFGALAPPRTSSTACARAWSPTRSATAGSSPRRSRMLARRRSSGATAGLSRARP